MARPSLGIQRIEALHYYVHDLERTRRFFADQLDFVELGASSPELEREGRQRSAAFRAGEALYVLHQPVGEGGRAWRYLRKHPEGVGTVVLDVEDIERTFHLLDERGGTFITDVQRFTDDGGTLAMFSITTPFGDTTFRFVERRGYRTLFPGFVPAPGAATAAGNRFGFERIDHLTANFQTMKPALLWMEHVLGFEQLWEIAFHTQDVAAVAWTEPGSAGQSPSREGTGTLSGSPPSIRRQHGSGLKSIVMWDPASGVKFANNEPFRPFFKESQINLFAEDNRGDGIQHSALSVKDIVGAVRGLRAAGVEFMPTPGSYYDVLPARLQQIGVGGIDESVDLLRELEILVDGSKPRQYLLQIFLKEAAGLYHDPEAGPFFFEIIQRKGDQGFGAGNFRALFEAIEREQARGGGRAGAAPPRM
ncbi:MAG TPA: VOC family protein [Polyangia bacterium]|nr:VOC family protein [Polyangia bacterium]